MIEFEKKVWKNKNSDGTIPEGAPAINAQNLNRIEETLEKCVEQANDYYEKSPKIFENLKRTLIWENNSKDEAFGTQTIECDLSEYGLFIILTRYSVYTHVHNEHIVTEKDYQICLRGAYDYNDKDIGRAIKFTDNGISFGNMIVGGSPTSSTSYNKYIIPVKIIGYKLYND